MNFYVLLIEWESISGERWWQRYEQPADDAAQAIDFAIASQSSVEKIGGSGGVFHRLIKVEAFDQPILIATAKRISQPLFAIDQLAQPGGKR